MGLCVSQPQEQSFPPPQSFARVTDAELQLRTCSVSLAEYQISSLLETSRTQAYETFLSRVNTALKPETRPMESKEFARLLAESRDEAANHFRLLFRQGKEGENVPFPRIKEGEMELQQLCAQDSVMFAYCNTYRSFVLCSTVKQQIVQGDLKAGNYNKAKLLKTFDKEAAGEYFSMCRNDLESLIDSRSKQTYEHILAMLKKQTVADREILRKEKHQAEALSSKTVPALFSTSRAEENSESAGSYLAMQSRLSLFDLIDRMREEDGASPEDFFTLQGQVVTVGPIKKHRSAEDNPIFYPPKDPEGHNCSQKAQKLALEESTEDSFPAEIDFADPKLYQCNWVEGNRQAKVPA